MSERTVRPCRRLAVGAFLLAVILPGLPIAAHASSGWTAVAPFPPPPRQDHAAAVGPDYRVYLIGGQGDVGPWAGVSAYTPSSNSWNQVAPMSAARDQLAATTSPSGGDPNGRVYALGGNDSNNTALNTVEQYTPSTNTWTTVSPMPTPRKLLAAATGPDGRVYAIGGCCNGSNIGETNIVEVYTPSTDHWATATPLNHARWGAGATTGLDGRIYVVGGCCPNGAPTGSAEVYDPTTGVWTDIAPMPAARKNVAAATGADGLIYAIGGNDVNGNPLATVVAYNPATNQWSSAPTMSSARGNLAAVGVPAAGGAGQGRLYAIGGNVGSNMGFTDTVEALDTNSPAGIAETPAILLLPAAGLAMIGAVVTSTRRRSRRVPAA